MGRGSVGHGAVCSAGAFSVQPGGMKTLNGKLTLALTLTLTLVLILTFEMRKFAIQFCTCAEEGTANSGNERATQGA